MKQFGFLTLLVWLLAACSGPSTEIDRSGGEPVQNYQQYFQAFKAFQIIGEGTDFLTVQIELPQPLPPGYSIYALAVGDDGNPLRKVTGFSCDPETGKGNHLWFYLFCYAPNVTQPYPQQSHYLQFILTLNGNVITEYSARNVKRWDLRRKVRIFDLPGPPDLTDGYLVLKDYTFLAQGDFRKPNGYYLKGKVVGADGRWNRFVPVSEILGSETEEMQLRLPTDKGWLELSNGQTHSMQDAVTPVAPYVEGWWDGKGYFHPRPLKVHR